LAAGFGRDRCAIGAFDLIGGLADEGKANYLATRRQGWCTAASRGIAQLKKHKTSLTIMHLKQYAV
jgi:hypothetical protein